MYHGWKQCEEPAVDYVEIDFNADVVRVWMCARHWDEHQKTKKAK